MCEVIVKELHRMRATRDMERSLTDIIANYLARASARRRPYTQKYISIVDLSPLGQINKFKIKL